MSRIVNIASAFLVIFGMWSVLTGLMSLFWPEWTIEMMEVWMGLTVSQIHAFSPNLLDGMIFTERLFGLCAMSTGLFICVISLIPYRKKERWAWYAMLFIGGITMSTGVLVLWTWQTIGILVPLIFIMLWIIGLALPAKEILSKPS